MATINFAEKGNGLSVILIHGFPFNQKIWGGFADELAKSFRVFIPDLPGFGESPALKSPFSINDVATELLAWIQLKNIQNPVIIGHSLGGYVALAMTQLQPNLPSGLVLFHSTAYADNDEKKANRNKVLDFISKNGVTSFTSNFIPPLFADQKHPSIEMVRNVAIEASEYAVAGYTKAMRDRPDQTALLKEFHKPVLIISGEKDAGITVDSVKKLAEISKTVELHILPDVAHMGMFEKPDLTGQLIQTFVSRSNQH